MTLRVVELFAGIGAQRMALTLAGIPHEVVAIAEINKHSLASYKAIYGDCPNLGDITKVERLPPCDLITYSFPCQDLSIAGKRAGMGEGTRSGLVWEVVRLLESAERERPEWLLMENVKQVLTAPEWPALVGRLEAMGYRNRWTKLDSSEFGSAQKRVRAFMVSRLGQDPPNLPLSAPNAPRLCLRDVMEPERAEKYIRRIPLDRVKWRTPKAESGKSTPAASIDGETFYSKAMLYSSSSSPTVRTEHGKNSQIKVVDESSINVFGCDDGDGNIDQNITPSKTFLNRRYYEDDGNSPAVTIKEGRNIKVVAEEDNPNRLDQWNRVYSSEGQSPAVCARIGGPQQLKVVADWQRKGMDQANRLYSSSSSSPSLMCHGGGKRDVKVVDESELVPWMEEGEVCPMLTPGRAKRQNGPRYREPGDKAFTVNCQDRHGAAEVRGGDLVVSVLTPRECWRLMGFPEWAYLRASRVSSETQLYNQAGNSIVVEVLIAIFNAMFRPQKYRIQTRITEATA